MQRLRTSLKNLLARDRLTADGGSLWKNPAGQWRRARIAKFASSGLLVALSLFLAIASLTLPLPGKVQAKRAEATEIYARDNQTLLYKLRGDQNRTSIPFDAMPSCIKQATVAVEDKDFYKHHGLDPRGLGRAVITDVESRSAAQGGSTITQQLVKNALLSPNQNVLRKARELVLSLEIEQIFPKDKILELYLNEIPYGNSSYGIQAATQTYFGRAKNAKDLDLAQCATLASIPRAPTYYSPFNNPHPERVTNRAKFVLDRMVAEKYITGEQSAQAKAEIDKGLDYAASGESDIKAPHFVFYVKEQLEQQFGTKKLQEGGLRVVTTLDAGKQDIAEDVIKTAARTRFAGYNASNAALTSIDPKTGQIVAMVGSVDYFDTAHQGNVNVATAERQPGSSIKPIIYLAGFQKGHANNPDHTALNPATLLWDLKTDFGGGYAPNDYDQKFRGPVSARDALQQSLNVPSVKMLDLVGLNDAISFANRMGISSLKPDQADRYGLSLVLGGGEVKLVDLTSAYATMDNGGKRLPASAILTVNDGKKTIFSQDQQKPRQQEIVSPALAYQITNVLTDDAARAPQFGRNSALTLPGREVAAKTGTTDSYRDAWTVGYTPQLTAGVWLGNNDNSSMNQVGGSIGAAPIWQEYMRRALADVPEQKFDKPSGVKDEQVDKVTGLKPGGGATKNDVFTAENEPNGKSPVSADPCGGKVSGTNGLHSERPDNPAWEGPVQAYLRSHGLTVSGTTRENTADCGPTVDITSPGNGSTVSGTITIQAKATSDRGVKNVEFAYDGRSIGSADNPPFTVDYTIKDSSGKHVITAKATDNDGNAKTATITVTVGSTETPTPAATTTLTLSCTGHACAATATDKLTGVVLVNATTGETVAMTGSGTTYAATAPASWTSAFARGQDSGGTAVKSSTVSLSSGP